MVESAAFVLKRGDYQVGAKIVVEVAPIDAHACVRPALGGEGRSRGQADLLKPAASYVLEVIRGQAVVGDVQIGLAVPIHVRDRHAQSFAPRGVQSGTACVIREVYAIEVLIVDPSLRFIVVGRARGVYAPVVTELPGIGSEAHVTRYV